MLDIGNHCAMVFFLLVGGNSVLHTELTKFMIDFLVEQHTDYLPSD